MTDQPKLCPGCGGEMRGSETAYPCGRKPVAGSLETTRCVRHQLFDARAKVAEIRAVADRLATALQTAADSLGSAFENSLHVAGPASEETKELKSASASARKALAEYRKAVS